MSAAPVFDAIVAGGGPAGLSAARTIAGQGRSVLVLEQNHEIGSPIRTSGGSFIDELSALGIPADLYHPISRVRFLSPNNAAIYEFTKPRLCVIDVRGVFQYLAIRAIEAGAQIRTATQVVAPIVEGRFVQGVSTRNGEYRSRLVIDATGYRSVLLRHAALRHTGLDPGIKRFGVGSEYDFYAPNCDQAEALLIVGGAVAPSGYAWVFPWGKHRVRVGAGVIHPDSSARPDDYLDRFVSQIGRFGVNLKSAQPLEHHFGLIPSECFGERLAGDGILGAGDAAGQASSLVGEGIRWAIHAGTMAGECAAGALDRGDVSRQALAEYERRWNKRFGRDLRLAHKINQRISKWDDRKWDERLEVLKLLTPDQFIDALKTNLGGGWLLRFLASHPKALAAAAGIL